MVFRIQNLNDNALIVFHSESSWGFQNEYLMTQLYGHSGIGLQNWNLKSKSGENYKDRSIVEDWKLRRE